MTQVRGKWGCLGAIVAGGVGLVLFGLGFDGHTTEALPFGVVLLVAGAALGAPSLRALRAAAKRPAAIDPSRPMPTGGDRLPATIQCPRCGSPVPLRMETPTYGVCVHCQLRSELPHDLARQLAAGADAVRGQAVAERQIAETIASLPGRERALRGRLGGWVAALVACAALAAAWGWLNRARDSSWHGFVAFAVVAIPVALVTGAWAAQLVPKVTWGIVGRWTALRLPGVAGLSCRVCGAPLPAVVAPVLRCRYCTADSLATPAVVERVERESRHARAAQLSVGAQHRRADELASFSLVALPAVVLVAWFGIGAVAGGVGLRALGDVALPPDDDARFAVVRGCVAAIEPRATGARLHFSHDERDDVPDMPPTMGPTRFIGRRIEARGRIVSVYRYVRWPARHFGRLDTGGEVYFPSAVGGGERLCLEGTP